MICWDHTGREFPSKAAKCAEYGVKTATYDKRIKSGKSEQIALYSGKLNCSPVVDSEGRWYPSQSDFSVQNGFKNLGIVTRRLNKGLKLAPVNLQKIPVRDHLGNEFESIADMARYWGHDPAFLYYRLNHAPDIKTALTRPAGKTVQDHTGQRFKNVLAMCLHWGLTKNLFTRRRAADWTLQESLETPASWGMKKNG